MFYVYAMLLHDIIQSEIVTKIDEVYNKNCKIPFFLHEVRKISYIIAWHSTLHRHFQKTCFVRFDYQYIQMYAKQTYAFSESADFVPSI